MSAKTTADQAIHLASKYLNSAHLITVLHFDTKPEVNGCRWKCYVNGDPLLSPLTHKVKVWLQSSCDDLSLTRPTNIQQSSNTT